MIQHKFRDYTPDPDTEILILGTFHPDVGTGADYYYGRPRNYLWQLLPNCYGQPSLKGGSLNQKQAFMNAYSIGFADVIQSLDNVPVGQEDNYYDTFIDHYVADWHHTEELIRSLPNLKAVYFTRKTFQGIPNIARRIKEIENCCQRAKVRFGLLKTPSRFANQSKLDVWKQVMDL